MITAVALDDEPLALQLVTGYISKTPFLELLGSFDNPINAMQFVQQGKPDLVFLDIQMPDITGCEFARILMNTGSKVIFTTAYEKYAIQGFRLEVVDYLLKPYGYDEFLVAANKARKLIELERKPDFPVGSGDGFLFIKSDYKIKRINYDDILYIEGLKDYIKLFLKDQNNPVLSLSTLKAVEAKLPPSKFMRVHRSFIVNLETVEVIERARIRFGNQYIPVSDQYKAKFQEYLDKNFL